VRRRALAWVLVCAMPALPAGPGAREADAGDDRPAILNVAVPGRLAAGRPGEARVTYLARRANVVAVVQVVEDLDGVRRATRQRELGVIAAAFGRGAGELTVPLAFETPGLKRVVLTRVAEEREESEAVSVEIEVVP
jgi:hypothetical protein